MAEMDEEKPHRWYIKVLSPKLVLQKGWYGYPDFNNWYHAHWCPACNYLHEIAVDAPFSNGAKWNFSGPPESPTYTPSVNYSVGPMRDGSIKRCHYFITQGKIQFCGDCTHALSGQTVDLPNIPEETLRSWEIRGFMTEEGGL